jgi:flagellar biosynthesis activator protein FlaF
LYANAKPHNSQSFTSSVKSDKDTEYEIILSITRQLKQDVANRQSHFPEFMSSVYRNRSLWSILAADVLSKENGLPLALKAKIVYLNRFVQDYSGRVVRGDLSIEPLIHINLSVLRGLASKGEIT